MSDNGSSHPSGIVARGRQVDIKVGNTDCVWAQPAAACWRGPWLDVQICAIPISLVPNNQQQPHDREESVKLGVILKKKKNTARIDINFTKILTGLDG